MSALSYICDYGNDEDTLSEESDKEDTVKLNRTKLPTPNLSRVAVVLSEDHIDDPLLHNGHTRAFPHVRGNWATFTYIEYPNKVDLQEIVKKTENLIASLNETCFINKKTHISLSKTFVLRYHMINSFTQSLQTTISNCNRFDLNFDSFDIYCNEDKTRTFLALKVDASTHVHLCNLIKKIDCILNEYRQPTFYEDPSFHMSLLSVTGDKQEKFLKIIQDLNDILYEPNNTVLEPVNIKSISCKSGNKIFEYFLK